MAFYVGLVLFVFGAEVVHHVTVWEKKLSKLDGE